MAIVNVNPAGWEKPASEIDVVQVDSDARDNAAAVLDIERWAGEHGFARVNEYWLRPIHKGDGRRVWRGACYRLTEEEVRSSNEVNLAHEQRVRAMPVTAHEGVEGR